jgi:hypothetical protein
MLVGFTSPEHESVTSSFARAPEKISRCDFTTEFRFTEKGLATALFFRYIDRAVHALRDDERCMTIAVKIL